MEQKCFTYDLHDALLRKLNNDFWKSWRSKVRINTNHNTRHISGLINDADISAKFADFFSGLYCSNNRTWFNKLNDEYLNMLSTYIGYPILDSHFLFRDGWQRDVRT